jgi:hypothetical protein
MKRYVGVQLVAISLLVVAFAPTALSQISNQLITKKSSGYSVAYFQDQTSASTAFRVGSIVGVVIENHYLISQKFVWTASNSGSPNLTGELVLQPQQAGHINVVARTPGTLVIRFKGRNIILKSVVK